jgi:hypothetical protein
MNPEFDWGKVKVRQAGGRSSRPRGRGKFVRVPMEWVERLAKAKHAATLKLALALLNIVWRSPGSPIRLSNEAVAHLGISRLQKYRAVDELVRLGLVLVKREGRRSPLVTVLKIGGSS